MSDTTTNLHQDDNSPSEFLYLDNFRGFNNTLIPFRDVTFLVGENSTGKSSVMSVLHLVRNFTFWHEPDFDSEDQHLGGFNDLLSAGTKQTDSFIIGTARHAHTFGDKLQPFVLFATFTNREGLPHISKLSFVGKVGLITVLSDEGEVFYIHQELILDNGLPKMSAPWISDVANRHKEAVRRDATKLSVGTTTTSLIGLPLFHLVSLAERLIIKKQTSKDPEDSAENLSSIYNFMTSIDSAVWLAPIRTKPRRTYDGTKKAFSAEGDHTPYLLKKQLLDKKGGAVRFKALIGNLGKDSHLFRDLKIKSFGSGDSAPFEVQVNLGGVRLGLSNVGYGVSQVLPILAEIVAREKACSFHIQQPEVHLHPRAQAALGDLFFSLARDEGKKFVIETHSDYLIDRYRSAMRDDDTVNNNGRASVVFFSRSKGGNAIIELVLTNQGSYPLEQPPEFRDFFIHEQMRNLGI